MCVSVFACVDAFVRGHEDSGSFFSMNITFFCVVLIDFSPQTRRFFCRQNGDPAFLRRICSSRF